MPAHSSVEGEVAHNYCTSEVEEHTTEVDHSKSRIEYEVLELALPSRYSLAADIGRAQVGEEPDGLHMVEVAEEHG